MLSDVTLTFPARRALGKMWVFIAGFGVFIPIGLAIYFFAGQKEGFLFAAFGVLPVGYIILRVLAFGSGYYVDADGVRVKHGCSKRRVPFDQITGYRVLNQEQTQNILDKYRAPAVESERNLSLKAWYQSNKRYGNFIRYCSVPIVEETASHGVEWNIVYNKSHAPGEFFLLRLSSDEEFLLSPEDPGEFFKALSSKVRLTDNASLASL